MKSIIKLVLLIAVAFNTHSLLAQGASMYTVVNRKISVAQDGSLNLAEADNAGIAWIKNKQFTTGTIEFDVKGRNEFQRSFVGVAFHGLNDTTYESVYFRPFNFVSTEKERKSHGVQYIAMPKYDWFVLRERFPDKYEHAVIPAPDPNGWFHVKVVVTGNKISTYVGDVLEPVLVIEPLVKSGGKQVGYWVGNGSPGEFKNLKITISK